MVVWFTWRWASPLFKRLAKVFNDARHIFNADTETEEDVVEFFRIEALPIVVFIQKYEQTFIIPQGNGRGDDL